MDLSDLNSFLEEKRIEICIRLLATGRAIFNELYLSNRHLYGLRLYRSINARCCGMAESLPGIIIDETILCDNCFGFLRRGMDIERLTKKYYNTIKYFYLRQLLCDDVAALVMIHLISYPRTKVVNATTGFRETL